MGSGADDSAPSSHTFNRSPGQYHGVLLSNPSVAQLTAADCGLFARGDSEKPTGPWAEVPFASASRGADPTSDSGPGAESLMAGPSELSEPHDSNGFVVALEAF